MGVVIIGNTQEDMIDKDVLFHVIKMGGGMCGGTVYIGKTVGKPRGDEVTTCRGMSVAVEIPDENGVLEGLFGHKLDDGIGLFGSRSAKSEGVGEGEMCIDDK